jgi:uncharacterized protein (TIGR02145 family)
MKMKSLCLWLLAAIALTVAPACSDDDFAAAGDDALHITATATPFVEATRAGSNTIAYRLYAVKNNETSWITASNNATASTATAGCYGESETSGGIISGSEVPSRFNQTSWYFAGISVSNGSDPAEVATEVGTTSDGIPTFTFARSSGTPATLPDVRYAKTNNAVGVSNVTNGMVNLEFKHSLAKIIVRIAGVQKTGTSASADKLSALCVNDYASKTLNMKTGAWSVPTDATPEFTQVNTDEVEFGSEMTTVTDEFLIFPTNALKIKAKINNIWTDEVTVEVTNSDNTTSALVFEANQVYTINIMYIEDGIHIVTAHPNYYDYVDSGVTSTLSVGTPTLFNGVVWADRNVGATSTTFGSLPEWEEMRGYYYQPGRNIPYKPYPNPTTNRYRTYTKDGSTYVWIQSYGDCGTYDAGRYLYPYIPGVWEAAYATGKKFVVDDQIYSSAANYSYSYFTEDASGTLTAVTDKADRLLIKSRSTSKYYYLMIPSNIPSTISDTYLARYKFISNPLSTDNSSRRWNASCTGLWGDNGVTPCPPGWRIPTTDEWRGIYPVSTATGDITYQASHTLSTDSTWFESSGDDPTTGYKSIYYCFIATKKNTGTTSNSGELFIIKKWGTSEAYGLHIYADKDLRASGNDLPDGASGAVPARSVLIVERYTFSTAPEEVTFSLANPPTGSNGAYFTTSTKGNQTRWFKVEQLKFPVCGVGHYGNLEFIWSGTEAQYGTAEGNTVRMKVGGSTSSRYVFVESNTNRTASYSIRPVRDASVEW